MRDEIDFILTYLIYKKGKANLYEYTLKRNGFNNYSLNSFKEVLNSCVNENLIKIVKLKKHYIKIEITGVGLTQYEYLTPFVEINNYNYILNYVYIIKLYLEPILKSFLNKVKLLELKFRNLSKNGYIVIFLITTTIILNFKDIFYTIFPKEHNKKEQIIKQLEEIHPKKNYKTLQDSLEIKKKKKAIKVKDSI